MTHVIGDLGPAQLLPIMLSLLCWITVLDNGNGNSAAHAWRGLRKAEMCQSGGGMSVEGCRIDGYAFIGEYDSQTWHMIVNPERRMWSESAGGWAWRNE